MAAEQEFGADAEGRTYYDVLGLPHPPMEVSLKEIKAAYRRALLSSHPDKVAVTDGLHVSIVREAWAVLSNDVLRKEYDRKIAGGERTKNAFVSVDLDDMTYHEDTSTYTFPCRCGTAGGFAITDDDLEKGKDVVECRGCSSMIRVSYEMVNE